MLGIHQVTKIVKMTQKGELILNLKMLVGRAEKREPVALEHV